MFIACKRLLIANRRAAEQQVSLPRVWHNQQEQQRLHTTHTSPSNRLFMSMCTYLYIYTTMLTSNETFTSFDLFTLTHTCIKYKWIYQCARVRISLLVDMHVVFLLFVSIQFVCWSSHIPMHTHRQPRCCAPLAASVRT